ncbi:SAVED domain-containing protein [Streptomyces sp. W16]|uniref:SAVED domain-containing protein n=1 Tax=Streptomyces sp. W16 TaxID=3076631 RepID=UPI00295A7E15|nr:SAVED domain-containing protein [Streptomyces sp. W16]MDV9173178.1 SAVED domain-containing protein [Streptomyces sp. W16]
MSGRTLNLGELAHIVGRGNNTRSPRGEHPLDRAQRENPDNLMLLCADQHDEVDAASVLDLFTVEKLRRIKQEHEDRIRHVTGLGSDRATTVVRMVGSVHGNQVELSRQTAAAALIAGNRYPLFLESYARHGLEIDLRGVPGESLAVPCAASRAADSRAYYGIATQLVDDVIERQLRPGIMRDAVRHVSVFGFARLPLLVHLGSRLDDTVPTDIYQRHREDESWVWREEDGLAPSFAARVDHDVPAGSDAVVVINVSGAIGVQEVPVSLRGMRRWEIRPVGAPTGPDIMRARGCLERFTGALRGFFAELEAEAKTLERLHVLPALPMSAAVVLGRVHHPQVHPQLVVYERLTGRYVPTLEIGGGSGAGVRTVAGSAGGSSECAV